MAGATKTDISNSPIWRPKPASRRLPAIIAQTLRRKVAEAFPFAVDSHRTIPKLQEFQTDHKGLKRWSKNAVPGSHEKPSHLVEIDWDYVAKHEKDIPFLGLKEYWYPVCETSELHPDKPLPKRLCGESIVIFRDANGKACAIEDRCPHRGPQLSIGQVGVVQPGTITCRYHGMTFDGEGNCIAVLGDGLDSPACGRIKARHYPTQERGGIIWLYAGKRTPPPIEEMIPHFKDVIDGQDVFVHQLEVPASYLAAVDNAVDMSHPSCLHRSCLPFASQSISVDVKWEEMEDGGIRAYTAGEAGDRESRSSAHDGLFNVSESNWYPPNIAFFGKDFLGLGELTGEDSEHGYVYACPRDIGTTNFWFIFSQPMHKNPIKRAWTHFLHHLMHGTFIRWPGSNLSCIDEADAVMMVSQGRVPNWDKDKLLRVDAPIVQVRRRLRKLHQAEVAEFPERGNIVPTHIRAALADPLSSCADPHAASTRQTRLGGDEAIEGRDQA